MSDAIREKLDELRASIASHGSAVVAFSGGVDSALVLAVAYEQLGDRAVGCIGLSPSYPRREYEAAMEFAKQLHAPIRTVSTQEHLNPSYIANGGDRCFHCKSDLYDRLADIREREGWAAILDGTHAGDLGEHRPGMIAAKDHGVRSPLAECGIDKPQVRAISRLLGLVVWDKPAMACLSSRVPTGTAVTEDVLRQIERAEDVLVEMGFRQFRVRHHGELARIELRPSDIVRAIERREEIVRGIRAAGYKHVTIDLAGFRKEELLPETVPLTIQRAHMIGYLDLPAGISGDMFLGCLVDAGWDVARLRSTIEKLKLPPGSWSIEVRQVMKGPLRATLVDVKTPQGDSPQAAGAMAIPHKPVEQRNLGDIRRIIESAELPEAVKSQSIAVFIRLANAEAKVHGMKAEEIHFHEVGAIDSIIDIVGTVAGLYELKIDKLYASAFPMSCGWTSAAHGQLPIPAPATLELLAEAGAPTREGPGDGELVTPTGAALVCALAAFERPAMKLSKIATGAGQRNTRWPNVARLLLGGAPQEDRAKMLVQLETNIDDMNPQFYAPVIEKLLAAGALDAWIVPVQMKKGRPGAVLSVLAESELESAVRDILFKHTTTLGVRVHDVRRHEARREIRKVETPFGAVAIKLKWIGEEVAGAMPEYEDCRKLAEAKGIAVQKVYEAALAAARDFGVNR